MTSICQAQNCYGDDLRPSGDGRHGADIAAQRADDLDQFALAEIDRRCRSGFPPPAVDLGCASGAQALRMTAAGAIVTAIDLEDHASVIAAAAAARNLAAPQFLQSDLRTWSVVRPQLPGMAWDIALCQRMLHYLPHAEALALLTLLRRDYLRLGAHLFISASGLFSELGRDYPHTGRPVAARFSVLAPEMAAKHGILNPVCLYSPSELTALLTEAGFTPYRVFSSVFGNVKAAAVCL